MFEITLSDFAHHYISDVRYAMFNISCPPEVQLRVKTNSAHLSLVTKYQLKGFSLSLPFSSILVVGLRPAPKEEKKG
jgi:hypothetical protein